MIDSRLGPARGGSFGRKVAIKGDVALVAAPLEGGGAVHVYTRAGSVWTEQAPLVANDIMEQDYFGLGLDFDGETAVVGAPGNAFYPTVRGAVYVFTLRDGVFTQQARLSIEGDPVAPPDLYFGSSVSIDGDTIWVGAPHAAEKPNIGRVVSFVRSGDQWLREQVIEHPDFEFFGTPVLLRGEHAWVAGGNASERSILMYQREAGMWTERERIVTSGAPLDACGGTLLVSGAKDGRGGHVDVYRNPALDPAKGEAKDEPSGSAGEGSSKGQKKSSGCRVQRVRSTRARGWLPGSFAALALLHRYRSRRNASS